MQTILHISKAYRSGATPIEAMRQPNHIYMDYHGLLKTLEMHFGLSGYAENSEYLRVELYRQATKAYLDTEPKAFFAASYKTDRFGTATALLQLRDRLVEADFGFDAALVQDRPRLLDFCGIEQHFAPKIGAKSQHRQAFGSADRWQQAITQIKAETKILPFELVLHEPIHLQPCVVKRLAAAMTEAGYHVILSPQMPEQKFAIQGTDLSHFVQKLLHPEELARVPAADDGSLLILRAANDLRATRWLGRTLRANAHMRPVTVCPTGTTLLGQTLHMEGFPTSGLSNASLARPSLQVLKLAPCFLWNPFDVYQVMEFVNLPLQPLDEQLATIISQVLAEKPGFDSELWFARVQDYLDQAEDKKIAATYQFLFKRRRYDMDQTVPRREALELYQFIADWATARYNTDGGAEFLILLTQAARICELLEALADERLTYLELEHVIRTVYEPTSVQITPESAEPYQICTEPGAFIEATDTLLWWNFVDTSGTSRAEFWVPEERETLRALGVEPDHANLAHQRDALLQHLPFLYTKTRAILMIPEQIAGQEVQPHALFGLLETTFEDVRPLTFSLDVPADLERLEKHLALPFTKEYELHPPAEVELFLSADPSLQVFEESREESFTMLSNFLYYPHTWFFQRKLQLSNARLLEIKTDTTLLGNLAHRYFEELLPLPQVYKMSRNEVYAWVDAQTPQIMQEEGATLLLYGREIERLTFLHLLRRGLATFVQLIQKNGWHVKDVEFDFTGKLLDTPVKCRADVILERNGEQCILDLKWSGATQRMELINNREDIQLITYARTLPPADYWPHTGFYIISESKLIMRNRDAFQEAIVPGKPSESTREAIAQEIWDRLEATFAWRLSQLRAGQIEIRTTETAETLEHLYAAELVHLLNLPRTSGRYDAYLTLVQGS